MAKLDNLELIEVVYGDDNKKATLVFLDEERGHIHEVGFNKRIYKDGSFIDDTEKACKVEKWCQDFFNLTFDTLTKAIGERKDVYEYDRFNSLFEVSQVEKFDADMVGQIFEVTVTEAVDDGIGIKIRFEYEGKTYESKMTYSDYIESRKEWFVNPQKRLKKYKEFENKFHILIDEMDKLVGQNVMVEVKKAFGKFVYADIKPFPKKK